MMKMKMKTMMVSVPPIQFSKNSSSSPTKTPPLRQHKVNSSSRREEDDDIFEDAHFTAFCISSFLERERERERVGRTALNVNAKRQQLTEN